MNAIVLSIGDELVSGLTVNTNASWLSAELTAIGIGTVAHVTVADQMDAIVEALEECTGREGCEVLLISGGLGPTEDDLTRQALAKAMKEELVEDAMGRAQLDGFFAARGRPMPESNLVQALRPKSARCLANPSGTAPGLAAEMGGTKIFVMPGVPSEMKGMFLESVLPELRAAAGDVVTVATKINTFGMGESAIGEKILDLMPRAGVEPGLTVGTTVHEGVVSVRIYATGRPAEVREKTERIRRILHERLGTLIFGENEETFEGAVVKILREKKKTVGTAESCTGGLLAELLTNVAGASEIFMRGWVTYSNLAKVEEIGVPEEMIKTQGAVSELVAVAMAEGARRVGKADFGIGITGIAGPDGGSAEKPVGLVWIGVATGEGTVAKRYHFPGDRKQVRLRAAQSALYLLRNTLLGVAI